MATNDPLLKPAVEPERQMLSGALYSPSGTGIMGRTVQGGGQAKVNTGGNGLQTAETATAGYQAVDPIYRTVDKSTETVQGQLKGILDDNSPLIQRARQKAYESMNSRGLMNSSMALGAADAAMYDVAIPIATSDANTFTQASRDNQGVANQTAQFNASAFNENERFNVGQGNDTARFNAQQGNQLNLTNIEQAGQDRRLRSELDTRMTIAREQNQNQLAMQQMSNQNAMALERLRANNNALIQGSANAGQIWSQMQANITNIQTDPNLSSAAKDALVRQQVEWGRAGMTMAGRAANVDFGDTLDWSASLQPAPAPAPVAGPPPRYSPPGSPSPGSSPARDPLNGWSPIGDA